MPLQPPSPLTVLSVAATRTVPPAIQPAAESVVRRSLASVRVFAFWTAILLPLVYLPALFGGGSDTLGLVGQPLVVLGLLALNLLAFLVGHDHNLPEDA